MVNSKGLALPVTKASFMGFSPRTENGVIVQVAADLQVEYEGVKQHEIIYSGSFGDIIGPAMPQEVSDALAVLSTHFGGLVFSAYGVLPS